MPDVTSCSDAAKMYAARGWRPIRLHGVNDDGHCTCPKGAQPGHRSQAGKHPTDNGWQDAAPMSPEELEKAWAGWRAGHNIGIATGAASGFFVLDIDPDNGGDTAVRVLQERHGRLTPTMMQRTGSGGWHMLYAMPDFEVTNSNSGLKEYPGLDIRGTGGQIVVWPSRSAKGPYAFREGDLDQSPAAAPEWLLELLRPKAEPEMPATVPAAEVPAAPAPERARLHSYAERVRELEVGRLRAMAEKATSDGSAYVGEPWDTTTFHVACSLLELQNSPWANYGGAVEDVWLNAPRDAGFGDEQVRAKIQSAQARVGSSARPLPDARPDTADIMAEWMAEPGSRVDRALLPADAPPPPGVIVTRDVDLEPTMPARTWDDLGNAMRMVDHFGSILRYVDEAESWALYGEGRWRLVKPNVVQGMVQHMIDVLVPAAETGHYDEVPEDPEKPDENPRAMFLKWLKAQRMSSRLAAAQKEAAGRPEIHVSSTDFDAHPFLLNVANGVVDLVTGQLHPAAPHLLMMKQSPVTYDPAAPWPRWQSFLDRVQPDRAMQGYLQRLSGYTITADTREQAFFLHHGDGANGKSVWSSMMSTVLGDYGQVVAPTTLLSSGQEQHPTGMAMMEGKRWLPATETGRGKRLDEEKIKNLTGSEPVSARFMGKDFFDFRPVGKLHLITNHLPLLSDAKSIWRRIHLVKWGVSIPLEQQDRTLEQTLKETEMQGILVWLVRGAQQWMAQGLQPPVSALADLAAWRDDSDTFADYLGTHTLPAAPDVFTSAKSLYDGYQTWAFASGIRKPMTLLSFAAAMEERGYPRARSQGGVRGFTGVIPHHLTSTGMELPWD